MGWGKKREEGEKPKVTMQVTPLVFFCHCDATREESKVFAGITSFFAGMLRVKLRRKKCDLEAIS